MGIALKNLCLVCNKVLHSNDIEEHIATNMGHVTTEIAVWEEYDIQEIDVTTSVMVSDVVTIQPTNTQADVLKRIYRSTDDEATKARFANIVNAPFLSSLETQNWALARYIATATKEAGGITADDLVLVLGAIPEVEV